MNNHERKALIALADNIISYSNEQPGLQELARIAVKSLTAEPVADEEKMLAEQAKAVIHCLDMCEVPEGDYADNPQLKLWGRVIEYGRLPASVVPDVIDNTAQQYEALAGWKMVPVEPSKEMRSQIHPIADGNCSHCGNRTTLDCEENMLLSWRDMLEAAPKPEA